MNIQEIRDNAPKGATHYNYKTETYYRYNDDGLFFYEFEEWKESYYKKPYYMIYIKPLY